MRADNENLVDVDIHHLKFNLHSIYEEKSKES